MVEADAQGTAILLAAGYAHRFGRDKRLERLGSDSLLNYVCRLYSGVFNRVIVVIRNDDSKVQATLTARHEVAYSEHAAKGISQSLIAGVQSALNEPWVVIGLADMPFVKSNTLYEIRNALCHERDRIVRPQHDGKPGNPVGFPSIFFSRLLELTGDQGARKLIEKVDSEVIDVRVDDPGIHIDIDTPRSFHQFAGLHGQGILSLTNR